MDAVTLTTDGRETRWIATLVGYEPGPIVQIELCIGQKTFPLARIFPPYQKGGAERLKALSKGDLAKTILELFRDGALEVGPAYLLSIYDDFEAAGRVEKLRFGAPIYVHPDRAV
jgi:hypothetical protein